MNAEIERFAKAVGTNPALRDELKAVGTEHGAVVKFANGKGYRFSLDDVKALEKSAGELSDENLQSVVGGFVWVFGSSSGYIWTSGRRTFVWF